MFWFSLGVYGIGRGLPYELTNHLLRWRRFVSSSGTPAAVCSLRDEVVKKQEEEMEELRAQLQLVARGGGGDVCVCVCVGRNTTDFGINLTLKNFGGRPEIYFFLNIAFSRTSGYTILEHFRAF